MGKRKAPLQSVVTAPNPTTIYEDLLRKGFSKEESATQVAQLWGLQVTHIGAPISWTISDITNLLFLVHRLQGTKTPNSLREEASREIPIGRTS